MSSQMALPPLPPKIETVENHKNENLLANTITL